MRSSLKFIHLLNLWLDSHQSSTAIPIGQSKDLTMFWYIDPIFKVSIQLTKVDFIAKIEILLEEMHGCSSDLSGYIIVTDLRVFSDLKPNFKVIVLYVGYLLNQWLDFLQTYRDVPLG